MNNGLISSFGIDPEYLIVLLFLIQIVMIILLVNLDIKYNRLKSSYSSFMRGKNGKDLEKSIFERFDELEELAAKTEDHEEQLEEIYERISGCYRKVGIVKYDAFREMGGKLSFAMTMLDEKDNGWILNAMHSREGCYTYIKEITDGQCRTSLSNEERKSLNRAINQDIREEEIENRKKSKKEEQ